MSPDPIDWHPARMLRRARADDEGPAAPVPRFALVILNQPLRDVATLETLWRNASLKVAADGGANRVLDIIGQTEHGADNIFDDLDVIIGDLDSLTPTARTYFTSRPPPTRVLHDADQESTDFGKAVKFIRASSSSSSSFSSSSPSPSAGVLDVVAMGGLGGRVDQGLSQLHHLYLFQTHPAYADGRMFLVSGESLTFLLKTGRHRVHVRERGRVGQDADVFDKYVGVVPVKEPSVISTKGLEWDVTEWATEFGGRMSTSNHVLPETEVVEVETTRDVLFTIALKR